MDINQTLSELYAHEYKGWRLGLGNIRGLLRKIGNPHYKLRFIHVAGTNGKGSVCSFIASILIYAGFKTALYTSPHLIRFNERFCVNNKEISNEEIVRSYNIVKPFIGSHTFFEITTAMAFLYFKEQGVDFVVLEVGLGGRLDATNVVKPLISVITNISLEHVDYLGNSIEKIAYEKAGIIKKNLPVVTSCTGKALEIIRLVAREKGAMVFLPDKIVKRGSLRSIGKYKNLGLGLKGNFQFKNSAIALKSIELIQKFYNVDISENAIRCGLENTVLRGRFEFVRKNILVDCAHNPDGVRILVRELRCMSFKRIILILGILRDKDFKRMVRQLNLIADVIILTKPRIERALNPEVIANYIKGRYIIKENIISAIKTARKLRKKKDIILVTGSIYLVGEALEFFEAYNLSDI